MGPDHDLHNEACGCCPAPPSTVCLMPKPETVTATLTPKEPKMSEREIGKLRRQYITKVHDTVVACGHKFHPTAMPKHQNCFDCWEAYFAIHTGMVAAAQSIVTAFGFEQLVKCNGVKFGKHYRAFVDKRNEEAKNGNQESFSSESAITS
jgi:hypothetical protein